MPVIKDPVYVYIQDPEHPAYGHTIEAPRSWYMEYLQQNKGVPREQLGAVPASGDQLKEIEELIKNRVAGADPATAAQMAMFRGGSASSSDTVMGMLDPEMAQEAGRLERENPTISRIFDTAGSLMTGGFLAKGAANLARQIPSQLGRSVATGAATLGVEGASRELGRQAREGEDTSLPSAAWEGIKNAGIGAALPLAGAAAGPVLETGLRAGAKAVPATRRVLGTVLNDYQKLGTAGRGAAAYATSGGSEAAYVGGRILDKGLQKVEETLTKRVATLPSKDVKKLAQRIRDLNPGTSKRDSLRLAEQMGGMSGLQKRAALVQENPLGGTSTALGRRDPSSSVPMRREFEKGMRFSEEEMMRQKALDLTDDEIDRLVDMDFAEQVSLPGTRSDRIPR